MMLKQWMTLAAVACGLIFPTLLNAQTKVGYVDVDRVTRKAKAVNTAMDSVQNDLEELQKQIEDKRRQIKDLQSDIERTEGVIAATEQEKKQKELQRLKNELDDLGYRAERKARELDATVFEPLMKKILFAIQDVAKEQKYDIVLRGEAVLYGSSAADITDDVIAKLNAEPTTKTPAVPAGSKGTGPKSSPKPEATPSSVEQTKVESSDQASEINPSPTPASPQTNESVKSTPSAGGKTTKPKRPVDRQPD